MNVTEISYGQLYGMVFMFGLIGGAFLLFLSWKLRWKLIDKYGRKVIFYEMTFMMVIVLNMIYREYIYLMDREFTLFRISMSLSLGFFIFASMMVIMYIFIFFIFESNKRYDRWREARARRG